MESSSLFASLERVSARYRQGVFRWSEEATPEALRSLEAHIGRPLPDGPIGVAVNGVAIYAYSTNLTKPVILLHEVFLDPGSPTTRFCR